VRSNRLTSMITTMIIVGLVVAAVIVIGTTLIFRDPPSPGLPVYPQSFVPQGLREGEEENGTTFDQWIIPASGSKAVAFYEVEMPKLGWVVINNQRRDAVSPVLLYQSAEGGWSATVQFAPSTTEGAGTEVKIYRRKLGG